MLGIVIVERAEAGQERTYPAGRHFPRREATFRAERITPDQAVTISKYLINADGSLIIDLQLIAHVHVVVAVGS